MMNSYKWFPTGKIQIEIFMCVKKRIQGVRVQQDNFLLGFMEYRHRFVVGLIPHVTFRLERSPI